MDWLAKEVIAELKMIIEKQSSVLDQVRIRKEEARFEYDINEKIESEMMQEEWMMRRAISLLADAYEGIYYTDPNLDGVNREEIIIINDEEQNPKRRLLHSSFQFLDGSNFFLYFVVVIVDCEWLSIGYIVHITEGIYHGIC